jgi:5-methylcytosine-specific restriction endonuclease McrBC regulatory subunit McrC
LHWSDPTHRSLGHLVPDLVVRKGRSIRIVDAKYKAHLVELDESGWHRFAEASREAHRADLHQVLAYSALYDADEITASVVNPLRYATWEALHARNRERSVAELYHGGRRLRLELRGLPFGNVRA